MSARMPTFHVMIKPRGPVCNLDCGYCYYLPKKALYPGQPMKMSLETLESFTRQYLQAQRVPEVVFGWQGGEPTMLGVGFFEKAIEIQRRYAPEGVRVLNTMQTNGTLLDDGWGRFLHDNNFLVGISIDGPAAYHDAFRKDPAGNPSHARAVEGWKTLQRNKVEANILCTVHAANARHPVEVYKHFRDDLGADFVQFIPIVKRANATGFQEGADIEPCSVTGSQYGKFLVKVFEEWVTRDVGKVFVQIFDITLGAFMGMPPALCVFSRTCGNAMAMEFNGDLYACDHFVEPGWLLGNINETPLERLVVTEKQLAFGDAKLDAMPGACKGCEVRFACNGGCPKNRVVATAPGEPPLNHLCKGYKRFFTHVAPYMKRMAAYLRAGQPAAAIMEYLATARGNK